MFFFFFVSLFEYLRSKLKLHRKIKVEAKHAESKQATEQQQIQQQQEQQSLSPSASSTTSSATASASASVSSSVQLSSAINIVREPPLPSISILKPLKGVDPNLQQNLETFFTMNYQTVMLMSIFYQFE